MKQMCIGVKGVAGTAKATGNAFEMCSVRVLVPIEVGKFGTVVITGGGFEEGEIPCEASAVAAIAKHKFPLHLELICEQRFFRGKLETVVTGVEPVLAAAPAPVSKAG